MYELQWGTKTPGCIVFLIDQSGSMCVDDNDKKVVMAIQKALFEMVAACIQGDKVKPRFQVSLIGYGDDVKEIWSGWNHDETFVQKLFDAQDANTSFIQPVSNGGTPMADAFRMAKTTIQDCIKDFEEQKNLKKLNGIPAPIVINVTDGYPDDEYEARQAAKDLLGINTDDGDLLLFNMHITNNGGKSSQFPKEKSELDGSKEANFLFDISSVLDDKMVKNAFANGFERVKLGSKGMIANASGPEIAKFISFGSSVSTVSKPVTVDPQSFEPKK